METIGDRLKHIREKLLKVSRAKICDKYGLSPDTLTSWEHGRVNISSKGVDKCIDIYGQENIVISREWIITGKGQKPKMSLDPAFYESHAEIEYIDDGNNDTLLLLSEIEYFRSLSKNTIVAQISRTDMLPLYDRGDHVGGRLRYGKDIESCIGKDCIVKTTSGALYIRRIAKDESGRDYNLVCLNPVWNGNPEPVLFNVKIECAAPIIWHRRMETPL